MVVPSFTILSVLVATPGQAEPQKNAYNENTLLIQNKKMKKIFTMGHTNLHRIQR